MNASSASSRSRSWSRTATTTAGNVTVVFAVVAAGSGGHCVGGQQADGAVRARRKSVVRVMRVRVMVMMVVTVIHDGSDRLSPEMKEFLKLS